MRLRFLAAAAAILAFLTIVVALPASAATRPRIQWQAKICRMDELWRTRDLLGEQVIIRNDFWSPAHVCVQTAGRFATAWRVTSSSGLRHGFIGAFPDEFYGCSYGKCTKDARLPAMWTSVPRVAVTWITEPGLPSGTVNKALDIWLSVHRHVGGQAKGAEVMVWLAASYTPPYGRLPIVRVGGVRYFFGHHRACDVLGCWNYILFRRVVPVSAIHGLLLAPFFRFAASHHLASRAWFLEGVEAGTEIGWVHGSLTTDEFYVRP